MGVTFISRNNTKNIGDLKSTPIKYFDDFKSCENVDIMFSQRKNPLHKLEYFKLINNHLILGGGGLFLRESFQIAINKIVNFKYSKKKNYLGSWSQQL